MTVTGHDSLKTRKTLTVDGKEYDYFSLKAAETALGDISTLPYSLKVLLENLLRYEDGRSVTADDVKGVVEWLAERRSTREIAYRPARVLMQDFTGVPAVVGPGRDARGHGDPGRRSEQAHQPALGRSIWSSTIR